SMFLFMLLRVVVPEFYGDAVDLAIGEAAGSDPERVQQLKEEDGLTGNVFASYFSWAGNVLSGNLGRSLLDGRPVTDEIRARISVSFELGLIGLLSSVFFSV